MTKEYIIEKTIEGDVITMVCKVFDDLRLTKAITLNHVVKEKHLLNMILNSISIVETFNLKNGKEYDKRMAKIKAPNGLRDAFTTKEYEKSQEIKKNINYKITLIK